MFKKDFFETAFNAPKQSGVKEVRNIKSLWRYYLTYKPFLKKLLFSEYLRITTCL